ATRVHEREENNHEDAHQLCGGKRDRVAAENVFWRNEIFFFADPRDENSEVTRESDADGSDSSGLNNQEERPAIEESPQRRESFAQVNVLAARLGHHGGQFTV